MANFLRRYVFAVDKARNQITFRLDKIFDERRNAEFARRRVRGAFHLAANAEQVRAPGDDQTFRT